MTIIRITTISILEKRYAEITQNRPIDFFHSSLVFNYETRGKSIHGVTLIYIQYKENPHTPPTQFPGRNKTPKQSNPLRRRLSSKSDTTPPPPSPTPPAPRSHHPTPQPQTLSYQAPPISSPQARTSPSTPDNSSPPQSES